MSDPYWQAHLPDEQATVALGAAMADAIRASGATSLLLLLDGELGAGKTTFSRGLLRALGHQGPVPSPTYTLLEPYLFDALAVNHLDLYRLSDGSELEALGWRDLQDSVRLVEWPSRAPQLAAIADLTLTLAWDAAGRDARVVAGSETGRRVLAHLAR